MAPADFTYAGGSENYSVTSYAAVSCPGDATRTVPVAWTAEFVEDDGSGGYNVIARPEWLTAFTASATAVRRPRRSRLRLRLKRVSLPIRITKL